jgi:hypothetical protein
MNWHKLRRETAAIYRPSTEKPYNKPRKILHGGNYNTDSVTS